MLSDILKAIGEDGAFTRAFQTLFNAVVPTLSTADQKTANDAYIDRLANDTSKDVAEVQDALGAALNKGD